MFVLKIAGRSDISLTSETYVKFTERLDPMPASKEVSLNSAFGA